MARILVTGGAGYIGSTLVPLLLERGHHVTVLDNFLYRENSLAACCRNPRFDVHRVDVRVVPEVVPHLSRHDVVIPLAAIVGAPACDRDPVGAATTNVDAHLMLFRRLSKSQRVIMPTTNSAYGTGRDVSETSPLYPQSSYAQNKVEVERALLGHPLAVSLRLATVFGMSPRMRMDLLVNDFTWRAVSDRALVLFEGHFMRNYVHVRDVAEAFVHVVEDDVRAGVYNVGDSNANVSKRQLCGLIQMEVPGFVWTEAEAAKDPDQRDYVVSNAKFEATGWRPQVALEEGIAELVKGYRMLAPRRYANV